MDQDRYSQEVQREFEFVRTRRRQQIEEESDFILQPVSNARHKDNHRRMPEFYPPRPDTPERELSRYVPERPTRISKTNLLYLSVQNRMQYHINQAKLAARELRLLDMAEAKAKNGMEYRGDFYHPDKPYYGRSQNVKNQLSPEPSPIHSNYDFYQPEKPYYGRSQNIKNQFEHVPLLSATDSNYSTKFHRSYSTQQFMPKENKRRGGKNDLYRRKQNKIYSTYHALMEKYRPASIFREEATRGEATIRLHVKSFDGLCCVETALQRMALHREVEMIEIAFHLTQKGILVYIRFAEKEQIEIAREILNSFGKKLKHHNVANKKAKVHEETNNTEQNNPAVMINFKNVEEKDEKQDSGEELLKSAVDVAINQL